MDAVERIRRTVAFERCDRPPVVAQVFAHAAVALGRTMEDYLTSAAVAADCQISAQGHYGYDAVFAVLDLTLEAEALGGEVQSRRGLYPAISKAPFGPGAAFDRLAIPDPTTAGRMPMLLEMARTLRRAGCGGAAVVGLVQGPMTLAVQLVGMEPALCLAADEPERFVQLLDYAAAVSRAFGLALPRYAALGADIGNFDYCVDPEPLLRALEGSRLCLDGNVKPLAFVTAEPDEVERDTERLLRTFDQRGGFIVSSGCEIPPEAREANVRAMVRATLGWSGA